MNNVQIVCRLLVVSKSYLEIISPCINLYCGARALSVISQLFKSDNANFCIWSAIVLSTTSPKIFTWLNSYWTLWPTATLINSLTHSHIPCSGVALDRRSYLKARLHPTMPPYSGLQRQQIAQFMNFTQAKDAVAAKVWSFHLLLYHKHCWSQVVHITFHVTCDNHDPIADVSFIVLKSI